jgi:glycosyltransferase involved in cell wall biosynthesis
MATYNGEKHVREQLDSIARQTLLPFELVITDDGSADATLQIVEEFARRSPFPVTMIRNASRLGYADNFLKAASLCAGDLIAFCDQDDIWMEQKLRVCSGYLADPQVLLAIHTAQTFTHAGGLGDCYPKFSRSGILGLGACDPFSRHPAFAMVIKKALLQFVDNTRRPARLHSHDHWLWFLAASAGRIATISEILALYRQHGNNVHGAPRRLAFAQRLRRTAGIIDYDETADSELQCSNLLANAAEKCPEFRSRLLDSAAKMEFRSKLHRLRTRIYRKSNHFILRARIFSQILLTGGYFPDSSGTCLGPYHGVKDLFLGVTGIYRALTSITRS